MSRRATLDSDSRTETLLEEIATWSRFMAREPLDRALRSILRDPKHQAAYQLTDGQRSQTEIASAVGIDQTTVSDLWTRWRKAGVLKTAGRRPERLIDLQDLGWSPEMPAAAVPPFVKRRRRQT